MAEDIIDYIARKEGFKSEPYWDEKQWSIGHGSYAGSRDPNNKPNISVTKDKARSMLVDQLQPFRANVNKFDSKYNWTPNERDALLSFAYNIGSIDQLTANGTRTKAQIAQKMTEYHNASGSFSQGLFDRRKEEQSRFLGSSVPVEKAIETDLDAFGGAGKDVTEETKPNTNEQQFIPRARSRTNNYSPNALNNFDSYTYQWTVYMVHPLKAHRDPEELTESNDTVIISQQGVDDEVNIQSVVQDLFLSFAKENRSAAANNFAVTFLEPGGFTMFNRIIFAAQQLSIENHLDACYILKLEFLGWRGDSAATAPSRPFFYTTRLVGLTFDFRDGASTYYGNFVETKEDAFNRLELYLKNDLNITKCTTFGDFLSRLEKGFNHQLEEQLDKNQHQLERDRYKFTTKAGWAGWKFDQVIPDSLTKTRGISVSGDGELRFELPKGTALNSAIALALFQTKEFKRVLTAKGDYIKENPDDGEADPVKLAELTKWVKISPKVKYYMYDVLAKKYAKEITYSADEIIAPEIVHDPQSFLKLHRSKATQKDRLKNIFDNGLLKKRFDYNFTGLNTEVLDLDIKIDSGYYAIQALNSGALSHTSDLFTGSSFDGQKETSATKRQSLKLREQRRKLQNDRDRLQKDITKLEKESTDYETEAYGGNRSIPSQQVKLNEIEEGIKELDRFIRVADSAYERAKEKMREGYKPAKRIPSAAQRYITQSDLYEGLQSSSDNREDLPQKFEYAPIDSLATAGPEKKHDDIGSSMLGAMELNLNSISDLQQQQIFVRGDPYWLGEQNGGAAYETGGLFYFLNTNFPTYPDEDTGLIKSLSTRNQRGQFTITGLYRVLQVQGRYQDGQFTMLLKSFRDTNTNTTLLYEDLLKGYVE